MEKLIKNLANLGVDGKDAEVYLAVLRLKKATVIRLAKETGIKRTTIYHCLENLFEKALISKLEKDDKSLYVAEDPKESLQNLVKEKKDAAELAIPALKDIFGEGASLPEIKIYRNISGLRKIYEDILGAKDKFARYYISGYLLEELLGKEFIDDFVQKRIKKGIVSLSLRPFNSYKPEREEKSTHASQLRKVKFLPENYFVKPYMVIYDNKVVVISSEEKMGFVVESKDFAQAQKTIFDMLWNTIAI